MEAKGKPDATVHINVDTVDWHLGIANALLALHRAHNLDLQVFLTEFESLNQTTWFRDKDGEKVHSASGKAVGKYLSDLKDVRRPQQN